VILAKDERGLGKDERGLGLLYLIYYKMPPAVKCMINLI
jgi:hypothetical protein